MEPIFLFCSVGARHARVRPPYTLLTERRECRAHAECCAGPEPGGEPGGRCDRLARRCECLGEPPAPLMGTPAAHYIPPPAFKPTRRGASSAGAGAGDASGRGDPHGSGGEENTGGGGAENKDVDAAKKADERPRRKTSTHPLDEFSETMPDLELALQVCACDKS